MERRIFVCDLCGVQQETTNHWFSIEITRLGPYNTYAFLTICPLKAVHTGDVDEVLHLCGEQCVMRTVSEFISTPMGQIPTSEATDKAITHETQ